MEMNIRALYILAETLIQITGLFPVGEELIPVIQISSGFAFFFDQFYRFTCLSQPVGCLTSCGSCTYNDNTHIICFSFYIRLFTMEWGRSNFEISGTLGMSHILTPDIFIFSLRIISDTHFIQ